MINLCYILLILLAVLIIKLYCEGSLLINNNKNYDMDSDPNFQKILQKIKNDTDSKINAAVEEGFANGYKDMLEQDKNYSKGERGAEAIAMLFYRKDCHFCQDFMPVWTKIVNNLPNNIKYEEIECNENTKKANEYNITGVPTIILLVNNKQQIYMGDRSYNDINKFLRINGINLVERTYEQFDSTGYSSDSTVTDTQIFNQYCPAVTFDKQADLANDKYMFQIFNEKGQYGYATGNTKDGSVMTPFNAAYSVVDTYLSSLPPNRNIGTGALSTEAIVNQCASLYSNQIKNFDLCDNDKLNAILEYDKNVKNGSARINFDGTDYSSNKIVVNAIKTACGCTT